MLSHRGTLFFFWYLCFSSLLLCIMMNKDKDKKTGWTELATATPHTKCFFFLFLLHRERVIFKVGDEMIPGGKLRRSGKPLTSCRDE